MATDASSPAKFWDRIAARYAKRPVSDQDAYQRKLQVTRGYFRPDMAVLELGCGTGSTAIAHAPYVTHIHAVDVSSRMLAIAEAKAKAQQVANVSFECAGIDAFDAAERRYDAVLALNVLHLLGDWRTTIGRAFEMLRPGGTLVTSTACLSDNLPYLKGILWLGHALGLLPSVQFFTTETLVAAMRDAGFVIDYQWQPSKHAAVFVVAKRPPVGEAGS